MKGLPDDFDPVEYLRLHKDVAASGIDAAVHYLAHGRREGRAYRAEVPRIDLGRPIFFCHLPKTAGTALRMGLERAFLAHEIIPDPLMMARSSGRYPPPGLVAETLRYQREKVKLLRGHLHFSFRELLDNPITITVLREPVARAISQIKHGIEHKGLRREDALACLDRGELPGVPDNLMTRMLGGRAVDHRDIESVHRESIHGVIQDPQGRLSSAIDAVGEVDILGIDGLDEVAIQLAAMGMPISFRRMNVSGVTIKFSERHLAVIATRQPKLRGQRPRRPLSVPLHLSASSALHPSRRGGFPPP